MLIKYEDDNGSSDSKDPTHIIGALQFSIDKKEKSRPGETSHHDSLIDDTEKFGMSQKLEKMY